MGHTGQHILNAIQKVREFLPPDCRRSDIQNCTQEQLVNTYDNTIAYTDLVLSKVISKLRHISEEQNIETSLLYISDHGESLGESGVYLHGLPYAFAPKEQTHVPMIYWAAPMQSDFNLACLSQSENLTISHDNIFDTLLSIMSVKTKAYRIDNDAFMHCKSKRAIARTTITTQSTDLDMEISD